ncbi:MAG TPA: LuxR C-terminal-related transcriptional regulator [Nocardioidaceae bacterium]|nr:LuxR C-terminal-related transcriptional regulator [Nocardioidaceae bacterium]
MDGSEQLTDAGVSEREAEVLALLGEHLTNAQIAGRLYISVRTVESHVSSLLRKLDLADRRALAELADALHSDGDSDLRTADPTLPEHLTSFIGRTAERAALAEVVDEHRLITAVGPGGVGKTRLSVAVAADLTDRFADGAWYVDLVPVTEIDMIGTAVAKAFGFAEQPGRSLTDTVMAKLSDAEALVVLDNCEHLAEGVAAFVERLLSRCPRLTVLATSRVRLQVPFERVFPVPGLSLVATDGAGDAVVLFTERAAMAGWTSSDPEDQERIAVICEELDGIALAIELAAARSATFGLDGLEAGLADQLGLLAGGPRLDDRHRSVRSALDWSFGLLEESDQIVLRRTSVFAAPFTPRDAEIVAGYAPLRSGEVAGALARLADHSLLVVIAGAGETRYRMLETIRQYGEEQMADRGDDTETKGRHLQWCLTTSAQLEDAVGADPGFEQIADDLRAGLGWAAGQPDRRAEAYALAVRLAELTFARGMASEAQWRYEEAATLASDSADAVRALHLGASVAWGRAAGNEAIRLFLAAADTARQAGDPRGAAINLVATAELMNRSPGLMSRVPTADEQAAILADAQTLAFGDARVEAGLLTVIGLGDGTDPASAELIERAVELARRVGDVRLESAAMDQLTAARLASGEFADAVATVEARIRLLTPMAREVEMAWEYTDSFHMAPMVYLAVGDLETARRYGQRRTRLPLFRQSPHLAVIWQLTTAALAGDFDEAVGFADQFRRGWIEAGRNSTGGIAMAPSAAAMVYGIRGDDDGRREWLDIYAEMRRVVVHLIGYGTGYTQVFDGIVDLHHGRIDEALADLANSPQALRRWSDGAWRKWYAAVWAEIGVLAELPDRRERLEIARFTVGGNPVASAMVERAAALLDGDRDGLLAAADALDAAGCAYQRARTLILAGGEEGAEGEAVMAAIGAARMAT